MDIKALPKIDLHCHLDGSLTREMIQRHAGQKIELERLRVSEGCQSLTEYLTKFELPLKYLQDEAGLCDGAYSFIQEVAQENITYIEVRFAPMLSVHETMSCHQVIEAVLKGLQKGREEFGVRSNIITCAMRHHQMGHNLKMLQIAREYLGEGVCALDLAGDESRYPTKQFQDLFVQAHKLDMPFVIHSGETGSVENVRVALELGASRIGHGIALSQDKELMKEYAKRGIGVEMCPTSNLQTKAVDSLKSYPLKDFVDAGILVSVNTDNRTVSHTTLTKELELVYELYDHDEQLIKKLLANAEETAFN